MSRVKAVAVKPEPKPPHINVSLDDMGSGLYTDGYICRTVAELSLTEDMTTNLIEALKKAQRKLGWI